jgi:4-hydroxy-2-oxoheptanedioate aldolase
MSGARNPTQRGRGLRARWDAGQPALGMWAGIPAAATAEMAAAAGYDYVCVDLQHGMADESAMVSMFYAAESAGSTPLARPAWNEPGLIMRALDLGAAGVIVPLVNNAAEAARAVSACRYPPHGTRSYGPARAQIVVGSGEPADLAAVLCVVMVETREGLDNVEEIAATPDLDGIYIGPSDLSLALGLAPPGIGEPLLEEAIARVRRTCDAHGLLAGMHCANGRAARERAREGFKLITVAVDSRMFAAAAAAELAAVRDAP